MPQPGRDTHEIHTRITEGNEDKPPAEPLTGESREIRRRRYRIERADIERHGTTAGCRGCEAIIMKSSRAITHNDECRKRIEEELIKEGDSRIEKHNRKLAEAVEE